MEPVNIGLIYGSVREGRFCDTIARWAEGEIARAGGFAVDPMDPREFLPRGWQPDEEAVNALKRRIERADAFVVVTPEYNHAYPAALKHVIDSAYAEWRAKPVAFVSYGGISGGLRAVEQLRLVFAELHAVTLRDTVSIANPWGKFDAAGDLREPDEPARAMATMLTHLRWWATVLRDARPTHPLAAGA
jgi:NAD(P)H-dependent FMN reductase